MLAGGGLQLVSLKCSRQNCLAALRVALGCAEGARPSGHLEVQLLFSGEPVPCQCSQVP
jgi:hypothetical protein